MISGQVLVVGCWTLGSTDDELRLSPGQCSGCCRPHASVEEAGMRGSSVWGSAGRMWIRNSWSAWTWPEQGLGWFGYLPMHNTFTGVQGIHVSMMMRTTSKMLPLSRCPSCIQPCNACSGFVLGGHRLKEMWDSQKVFLDYLNARGCARCLSWDDMHFILECQGLQSCADSPQAPPDTAAVGMAAEHTVGCGACRCRREEP